MKLTAMVCLPHQVSLITEAHHTSNLRRIKIATEPFKPLEAYADTDAAAVAISQTSGLLQGLMWQQRELQREVELVVAQLGGTTDIEAYRQMAGQGDAGSF